MTDIIRCWDLDETILDTPRLFREPIGVVARRANCSTQDATTALKQVSEQTFTYSAWFKAMSIPPNEWHELEMQLRADVGSSAWSCVYPGMRELLEALGEAVLVTAGDPSHQQSKFDRIGLGHIFVPERRHFVPLKASKADAIRPYVSQGKVEFIEDRPSRLREVLDALPEVRGIRVRWPGSSNFLEHPDDGVRWQVADTIDDLERLLIKETSS